MNNLGQGKEMHDLLKHAFVSIEIAHCVQKDVA